jgi:hypothetical protein
LLRPWAARLCGVPPFVGPPQRAHPIGLSCALCRFARGAGRLRTKNRLKSNQFR